MLVQQSWLDEHMPEACLLRHLEDLGRKVFYVLEQPSQSYAFKAPWMALVLAAAGRLLWQHAWRGLSYYALFLCYFRGGQECKDLISGTQEDADAWKGEGAGGLPEGFEEKAADHDWKGMPDLSDSRLKVRDQCSSWCQSAVREILTSDAWWF